MKDIDIGQSIMNVRQRKRARLAIPILNIGSSSSGTSVLGSRVARQYEASEGDAEYSHYRQEAGQIGFDDTTPRGVRGRRGSGEGPEKENGLKDGLDEGSDSTSHAAWQADHSIGFAEPEDIWIPERTDDMTSEAIIAAAVRPLSASYAGLLYRE